MNADLCVFCLVDGSKSDSDEDRGIFSTYSSSSAFDKLSSAKKGSDSLRSPEGALMQHHSYERERLERLAHEFNDT